MKWLKKRLISWLLKDVEVEELIVKRLRIGENTVTIDGNSITLPGLTADPALVAGRMWYRSDLQRVRYSPDGASVISLDPPATAGDLENQYISLFKAGDARAARLLDFAEILVNAGLLSVGDVAAYLNSANVPATRAAYLFENVYTAGFAYNILASANLSEDRAQAILYAMPFSAKLAQIIAYGASDLNVTANTTISGVNRYRNLSVASGVALTVDGQPGVIIADTITVSGAITKTATGGAGGSPGASGAGAGGAGGGGLIIFARRLSNVGTISANGVAGAAGSTVAASGKGGSGGAGSFFAVYGEGAGKGGSPGSPGSTSATSGVNGAAGGGYISAAGDFSGGSGDGSTVTLFTNYAELADYVKKAVVDWFLVNVLGKTPTTTTPLPNVYGSGGGGGGAFNEYNAGGGGGGGGGEIIALVAELANNGTIRANGGNGGAGGAEGTTDCGGGGGGGGIVYVFYKIAYSVGTLSASGGTGGGGDYTGYSGGSGTAKAAAI